MDKTTSRWRRNRFAAIELILVAVAALLVLRMGAWVSEPIPSLSAKSQKLECPAREFAGPALVRLELAATYEGVDGPLPSLDELTCSDPSTIGRALSTSTSRDQWFIPAYVALLLWCSLRMAGFGGRGALTSALIAVRGRSPKAPSGPLPKVLATVDRWSRESERDAQIDSAKRRARAQIQTARQIESDSRREIRHDRGPEGAGLIERFQHRRRRRKEAKAIRKQQVRAARAERDGVIYGMTDASRGGERRSDGIEKRVPARPSRWGRVRVGARRIALGILADRIELARVDRNHTGRVVARVAVWSVLAAGLLDAIENQLLFRTAANLQDRPIDSLGHIRTLDRIVVEATAGVAAAKFILLVLPLLVGVAFLWHLAMATGGSPRAEQAGAAVVIPAVDRARRWRVPHADEDGTITADPVDGQSSYGVCFSGGGIRSATFALGALQELEALEDTSDEQWDIRRARYVSAVSGGSYMAAAYQFLARGAGADAVDDRWDVRYSPSPWRSLLERACSLPLIGRAACWAYYRTLPASTAPSPVVSPAPDGPLVPPAGPVEDHLRRHATHLADGATEWIRAVGEIIVRALVGLFILLLVIWTVAVPLGWTYQYVLHGLDGTDPAPVLNLRLIAIAVGAFVAFLVLRAGASPLDIVARRTGIGGGRMSAAKDQVRTATGYALAIIVVGAIVVPFASTRVDSSVTTVARWVGVASGPHDPDRGKVSKSLDDVLAGSSASATAAVKAAALVEDQPGVPDALEAAAANARLAAAQAEDARVLVAQLVDPPDEADDALPVLAVRFDPFTCDPVVEKGVDPVAGAEDSIAVRACEAVEAAGVASSAVATIVEEVDVTELQGDGAVAVLASLAAEASAGTTKASAGLRSLGDELKGSEAPEGPVQGAPLRWAGLSALLTAVGGLFAKRRLDVAQRPARPAESAGNKVARMLGFGGSIEVIAGVAAAAIGLIAVSDVIVDAWRRGALDDMKLVFTQPSWLWWVEALGVLAIFVVRTNANTWSMRPFYHRRLWLPYAVTRDGKTAPWSTDTRLSVVGEQVPGYPELIICAASQTSGRDQAPPGRRALPFVFTATAVGGPEVGYVSTRSLERMLGRKHRSTMSLFGAVASSGAAFGPAMGRHSKGGLGAVIAIANARLGAWLPNPRHLALLNDGHIRAGSLARWPRLWYWFMEIVGKYPADSKLVLTTDGGHVENLGLVELLRRRCDRILCFDASGAGATPATLAEAIVLAREELGIEIVLDLPASGATEPGQAGRGVASFLPSGEVEVEFSLTSPPAPAAALLTVDKTAADPLRRRASMVEELAARIAGRPVLTASIRYPEVPGHLAEAKGTLIYGTLALADDGPQEWDILEYAQRNGIFPNDGTGRQWFDASTFSAYQQLGRRTARRMVEVASAEATDDA